MAKINIKIDGRPYQIDSGLTILEAAKQVGYDIPTLCYYKDLVQSASCRVCLVEVKNARSLLAACNAYISEGMEITLTSPRVLEARKHSVELLLSNHHRECTNCVANNECELQAVAKRLGISENKYDGIMTDRTIDEISPALIRDTGKCILCGRCIEACKKYQGIGILDFQNRGFKTIVGPAANRSFATVPCMYCGQCTKVCPTGALTVKPEYQQIIEAMKDGKKVVVQTAPAVRAALGEEFGYPIGTAVTGKMVASLHRLGFYRVFDTNFAADLTIMEETQELIDRITNKGVLPMITSCSPGWVRYCEFYFPEVIPHISSCKSPQGMMGATIKSYFAQAHKIDPKEIVVVSVMPCSAKKFEKERYITDGMHDVDICITTHELASLIKAAGIDFNNLPDEEFDNDLLGEYSGAGVIFGASGGVMEAALRNAYYQLTGKDYPAIEFTDVRAHHGVKEASLDINGLKVNVAVVSSMAYAKPLLEQIKEGNSLYQFIEIMGCPSGCVNGAGQPKVSWKEPDYIEKRRQVLYSEDKNNSVRLSYKNEDIIKLYKDYVGKPGSHVAHKLYHTTYEAREKFKK